MRRDLERHQPDGRDAEAVQIVQPPHQPFEIANAVAIGIHISANREAIDHRVFVPKVIDHQAAHSPMELSKRNALAAFSLPRTGLNGRAAERSYRLRSRCWAKAACNG